MYLAGNTKWEAELDNITQYINSLVNGGEAQKLGGFYHDTNEVCCSVDEALSFKTEVNSQEIFSKKYFSPNYYFLGDSWSVVNIIRMRLGLEDSLQAFEKIRREITHESFDLTINKALIDTIKSLRKNGLKTFLYTNTPAEFQAVELIERLGFDIRTDFNSVECGIQKPYGLALRLPKLMEQEGLEAHEILTIGDHSFNDLSPVKEVGGNTLLISPYEIHDNIQWDLRLSKLEELQEFLADLAA